MNGIWNFLQVLVTFTTICGNSAKTRLLPTDYFDEKNNEKEKKIVKTCDSKTCFNISTSEI